MFNAAELLSSSPSPGQPTVQYALQSLHQLSGSIEFFTIGVSVRLSDKSLHREEQNKIRQKLPAVGLKPGPPDLQDNALPTELGRNLLSRRFLK